MQSEITFAQVVSQGRFLLIYPVYTLHESQSLLLVIIDEHLLLEHTAHVLHRRLVIYPVIGLTFRYKYLSRSRSDKNIGLDIAHHGLDERVEPVIYGQNDYKSSSTYSHTYGAYRRNDVDHIM